MGMSSHQDNEMPRNDMEDSQQPPDQDSHLDPDNSSQSTESMSPEKTPNCISLPNGLKTPSGNVDGASFQGTFRGSIKDGKLYFDSINNIPLGDESKETAKEESEETPEEQAVEEEMGTEQDDINLDEEDKMWRKKQRENNAFSKAFHG